MPFLTIRHQAKIGINSPHPNNVKRFFDCAQLLHHKLKSTSPPLITVTVGSRLLYLTLSTTNVSQFKRDVSIILSRDGVCYMLWTLLTLSIHIKPLPTSRHCDDRWSSRYGLLLKFPGSHMNGQIRWCYDWHLQALWPVLRQSLGGLCWSWLRACNLHKIILFFKIKFAKHTFIAAFAKKYVWQVQHLTNPYVVKWLNYCFL